MSWMKEIEVVIFDMDGTLYQDHHFYKAYLKYLLEGTEWQAELTQMIEEAGQILDHQHSFKLGQLYHDQHDCAFTVARGEVISAHTWEGHEVNAKGFLDGYDQARSFWNDCIYAGDAWSVVKILSKRLNISDHKLSQAFACIRKDMISAENGMMRNPFLMKAIGELRSIKRKILMTNTDHQNGVQCVRYLGIDHLFDEVVYDAQKPGGKASKMKMVLKETGLEPHQVLSIGDNAWNDLHPVKQLGGRTLWISPYESLDREPWDLRLQTVAELAQFLTALHHRKDCNTDEFMHSTGYRNDRI